MGDGVRLAVRVAVVVDEALAVGVLVGAGRGDSVALAVKVGDDGGPAFTAANASTRPNPKSLLGTLLVDRPPQICGGLTSTVGFALFCRTSFVAAISRISCGR